MRSRQGLGPSHSVSGINATSVVVENQHATRDRAVVVIDDLQFKRIGERCLRLQINRDSNGQQAQHGASRKSHGIRPPKRQRCKRMIVRGRLAGQCQFLHVGQDLSWQILQIRRLARTSPGLRRIEAIHFVYATSITTGDKKWRCPANALDLFPAEVKRPVWLWVCSTSRSASARRL